MLPETGTIEIIPDGTEEIEPEAYAGSEITEVILPASLRVIGEAAFMDCSLLKKVQFLIGGQTPLKKNLIGGQTPLKEIRDGAFANCSSLESVVLPEGLEQIGEMAFFSTGLTGIRIPESARAIGEMAFWDCENLVFAEVAGKDTMIGKHAFGSCPKLTDGYFAPGFPSAGTPPELLQAMIFWCIAPERYDEDTGGRAVSYFLENEDLVMSQILETNNEKALLGLLKEAPELVRERIGTHLDRHLMLCREIGARRNLQTILLRFADGKREEDDFLL